MAQRKITDADLITALKESGSLEAAARKLNMNRRTLQRRKSALVERGFSPEHGMTNLVPEPFMVKGTSTLYDAEGNIRQQWVKSQIDPKAVQAILEEALLAFASEIPRAKASTKAPKHSQEDLLSCYVITDYHFGMLSWHEETGEDWDLQIAEDTLVRWFQEAIRQAPNSHTGILAQLGDFLHWDGMDAVTPASKHLLDADGRFQKLVRVVIRALRRIIDMLLAKHQRVHILMAEGNHDPASSIWLREWLAVFYEHDERVTVDTSADPYYCYEHGAISLFFHHGHKRNVGNVADVFAAKFREVWGRTKFSYAHMGHKHHVDVKENNLMVVEQHRTLAANDAYGSRGGWISGRDAQVITYSKRFGEVGRVTVNTHMLD